MKNETNSEPTAELYLHPQSGRYQEVRRCLSCGRTETIDLPADADVQTRHQQIECYCTGEPVLMASYHAD
jgi:hypothetical protein